MPKLGTKNAFLNAFNTVTDTNFASSRNKKLIFKNNAPFRSRISKINNPFTDNAKDLDIVLPMYNFTMIIIL